MEFGACPNAEHVLVQDASGLTHTANYTISGSALTHSHCYTAATVSCDNVTVTLTGTPAFTNYFCGNGGGIHSYRGTTFVGTATGMKYIVHSCGTIFNNGTDLPGSIAGTYVGGTYNNQIQSYGTPTGDVAGSNVVGEYKELTQPIGSLALTSNSPTTVVNIFGLTPGNYDIWAQAWFNSSNITTWTSLDVSISSTASVIDTTWEP